MQSQRFADGTDSIGIPVSSLGSRYEYVEASQAGLSAYDYGT
jgi:hypothetical protein